MPFGLQVWLLWKYLRSELGSTRSVLSGTKSHIIEPESSSRNIRFGSTDRLDALASGACEMSVICAPACLAPRPVSAPAISAAAAIRPGVTREAWVIADLWKVAIRKTLARRAGRADA